MALGLMGSIVELKVTFKATKTYRQYFKSLAEDMINLGGYKALRKLEFTKIPEEKRRYFDDAPPTWYDFFAVFKNNNVPLDLVSLCLAAPFTSGIILNLLGSVIISRLHCLELYLVYGEEIEYQTLEKLTEMARSLRHFRFEYLGGEHNIMYFMSRSILQNRPETLVLEFPKESPSFSSQVRQFIIINQGHLKVLMIRERSPKGTGLSKKILSDLKALCSGYDADLKNSHYISAFEKSEPEHEPELCKRIKKNFALIAEVLKKDVIYQAAQRSLPNLEKYVIYGLCINLKDRTVVLNGEALPLESSISDNSGQKLIEC